MEKIGRAHPDVPREPRPGALCVDEGALAEIVALLRARAVVDLRGYRRETVARRVLNRMISAGVPDVPAYLALLRADRAEAARLVERVTIKVSRFFRNRAAVEAVARALAAGRARARCRLSAWSAGCARGEEPYTIAMVLAELGQEGGGPPPVLATDVDPAALAAAAEGRYPDSAMAELPDPLRDRWLRRDGRPPELPWRVSETLRGAVELLRHDVARAGAAPGRRRFDLVCCRNTIIYFERHLQESACRVLCDALRPGGLLWLGEAEWPAGEAAARLETVDRAARLFRLRSGRGRDA